MHVTWHGFYREETGSYVAFLFLESSWGDGSGVILNSNLSFKSFFITTEYEASRLRLMQKYFPVCWTVVGLSLLLCPKLQQKHIKPVQAFVGLLQRTSPITSPMKQLCHVALDLYVPNFSIPGRKLWPPKDTKTFVGWPIDRAIHRAAGHS